MSDRWDGCLSVDVVVDGADNFPTRHLLHDAALKLGKPVIHASIFLSGANSGP